MALEDAVFTLLKDDAGVDALVAGRIYPVLAPEPISYPFIAYHIVSDTSAHAMGQDVGVRRRHVQVDCVDESATGARKLADAVSAALSRFMGTVNYTGGSTVIEDVYSLGMNDNFDFEARKFKRSVDFDMVYDG